MTSIHSTHVTAGSSDQQCQMCVMLLAGDSSTSNPEPETIGCAGVIVDMTQHGSRPDTTEVGTGIMINERC